MTITMLLRLHEPNTATFCWVKFGGIDILFGDFLLFKI
jgi:hypothetical protein